MVNKSNNLKQAREDLGLTQAQVAAQVKVHVNYYARVERGEREPSLKKLKELAKVLKVKLADILPS